jgi:hypothetical protein
MVGDHQPGQADFRWILPDDVDWKPFPAFPPSARLADSSHGGFRRVCGRGGSYSATAYLAIEGQSVESE